MLFLKCKKYLIPNMAFTVYKRVIYLKTTYKLTNVVTMLTYGIYLGGGGKHNATRNLLRTLARTSHFKS